MSQDPPVVVAPLPLSFKEKTLNILTGLLMLCALLGTLPVDSANLPMPPWIRPYIISIGFGAALLRAWLLPVFTWLKTGKIPDFISQNFTRIGIIGFIGVGLFSCAPNITTDSKSVLPDGTILRQHIEQKGGVDNTALGTSLSAATTGFAIANSKK